MNYQKPQITKFFSAGDNTYFGRLPNGDVRILITNTNNEPVSDIQIPVDTWIKVVSHCSLNESQTTHNTVQKLHIGEDNID